MSEKYMAFSIEAHLNYETKQKTCKDSLLTETQVVVGVKDRRE